MRHPLSLLVWLPLLAATALACGAKVVFETDEGAGGTGATSGTGATGDGGTIDPTTSSLSGPATNSTDSIVSSSSGSMNPCLGAVCGQECAICNEFECLLGMCGDGEICHVFEPAPCALHTLCYLPGPGGNCAPPQAAAAQLCDFCMGGKGCTFIGSIWDGPFVTSEGCCYDVTGDCVPNP